MHQCSPPQNNFTLQSLRYFSRSRNIFNLMKSCAKIIPKEIDLELHFTAKTAINVALETKTDEELIKILKDFIAAQT
ncbi:uncharacterized protein OCT59_022103 [Rhizophagus irregularis]|uniref:uncharacterized protein n=1 Tax=Rhizophagus irregularis TaxID=588596 RepID=UPI00331A6F3C|nr:hypothetical protein OCT59_022103 [Rhizophagus irregularis]